MCQIHPEDLPSGFLKAFPAHGEGGPLAVDEVPALPVLSLGRPLRSPAVLPPAGEGAPMPTLGRMREKLGSSPPPGNIEARRLCVFSPSPVASRHPPPLGEEQIGCSTQSSRRDPAAGSPEARLASPEEAGYLAAAAEMPRRRWDPSLALRMIGGDRLRWMRSPGRRFWIQLCRVRWDREPSMPQSRAQNA